MSHLGLVSWLSCPSNAVLRGVWTWFLRRSSLWFPFSVKPSSSCSSFLSQSRRVLKGSAVRETGEALHSTERRKRRNPCSGAITARRNDWKEREDSRRSSSVCAFPPPTPRSRGGIAKRFEIASKNTRTEEPLARSSVSPCIF